MYSKQFILDILTLPTSGMRENIPSNSLDDEEIVLALIKVYPNYYEKISNRLQKNHHIANTVFALSASQMKYAPFEIKDNFDIAFKALSGYGFCYHHFSERLKKHPDIIKECLSQTPVEFTAMSEEIRNTEEYFKITISKNPMFYFAGSPKLREDEEIFLSSCWLNHGSNLKHAGENIKNNSELLIKALNNNMFAQHLEHATGSALSNPDLLLKIYKEWPEVFSKILPEAVKISMGDVDPAKYLEISILHKKLNNDLITTKTNKKTKI